MSKEDEAARSREDLSTYHNRLGAFGKRSSLGASAEQLTVEGLKYDVKKRVVAPRPAESDAKTHQIRLHINQHATVETLADEGAEASTSARRGTVELKPEGTQGQRVPIKTVAGRQAALQRVAQGKQVVPLTQAPEEPSSAAQPGGAAEATGMSKPSTAGQADRTENSTKMISSMQHYATLSGPGTDSILTPRAKPWGHAGRAPDPVASLKPAFAGLQVQRIAIHSRGKPRPSDRNGVTADPGRGLVATVVQSTQIDQPVVELAEVDEPDSTATPRAQHLGSPASVALRKVPGPLASLSPPRPAKAGSMAFAANFLHRDPEQAKRASDDFLSDHFLGWVLDDAGLRDHCALSGEHDLSRKWYRLGEGKGADPKYRLDSDRATLEATTRRSNAGMSGGTAAGSISFRQMRKQHVGKMQTYKHNNRYRRQQQSKYLDMYQQNEEELATNPTAVKRGGLFLADEPLQVFSADGSARRVKVLQSPPFTAGEDLASVVAGRQANAFRLTTGEGTRPHHPSYKLRTPHTKAAERERRLLLSREQNKDHFNSQASFQIAGRGSRSQKSLARPAEKDGTAASAPGTAPRGGLQHGQFSVERPSEPSDTATRLMTKKSTRTTIQNIMQTQLRMPSLPPPDTKRPSLQSDTAGAPTAPNLASTASLPTASGTAPAAKAPTKAKDRRSKLKLKLAEWKRRKELQEDEDPYGLASDRIQREKMGEEERKPRTATGGPGKPQKMLRRRNAGKGLRKVKEAEEPGEDEQWTAVDYPRHIRLTSRLQSLASTRDALRLQKCFHHKFDLELADYANRHLYKDVYRPNERADPAEEKAVTTLEFIREHRPANMSKEPSMVAETAPAPRHAERSKEPDGATADEQYYDRLRRYPVTLIKQCAYRNAPDAGEDEPERALPVSQEGLKAQQELLLKRKKEMIKKLAPDFETRLRLHERGVDVELGAPPVPAERKDVYVKMVEMVEESERTIRRRFGRERQSYFGARKEAEGEANPEAAGPGNAPAVPESSAQAQVHEENPGASSQEKKATASPGGAAVEKPKNTGRPASLSREPPSRQPHKNQKVKISADRPAEAANTLRHSLPSVATSQVPKAGLNLDLAGATSPETERRSPPTQSVAELRAAAGQPKAPRTISHDFTARPGGQSRPQFDLAEELARIKQLTDRGGSTERSSDGDEQPNEAWALRQFLRCIGGEAGARAGGSSGSGSPRPGPSRRRASASPLDNGVTSPTGSDGSRRKRLTLQALEALPKKQDANKRSGAAETAAQPKGMIVPPQLQALAEAKLVLSTLEKSLRRDLMDRVVHRKSRTDGEEPTQSKERTVRKQVQEQLAVRKLKRKLIDDGNEGLIDVMDFQSNFQQIHRELDLAALLDPETGAAVDISEIKAGVGRQFAMLNKLAARRKPRGAPKAALGTARSMGCTCKKTFGLSASRRHEGSQQSPEVRREALEDPDIDPEMADKCEYCRSKPKWIQDWTADVDFSSTEPETERKLTQFTQKLFRKSMKLDPKLVQQQGLTQREKQKLLLLQLEELKRSRPEMMDLDHLLRLCFKEKEFVNDELQASILAQAGRIQEYNQHFLEAVVRMQENLQILQDPKENPGAPTLDAEDYEGQFNAKHVMRDQLRGGRDNHANFLGAAGGPSRKTDDKVNMRRILGDGRRKPWKPTRIEYGKALKMVLNSSQYR